MNVLKISLIAGLSLFFVLFLMLLPLVEHYKGMQVPTGHLLAITALNLFYLGALFVVFWNLKQGGIKCRLLWGIAYLLLSCTLFGVVDFFVLQVYPRWGIRLAENIMPYGSTGFHREVFWDYVFFNAVALVFVQLFHAYKRQRYVVELQKDLEWVRMRKTFSKHSSHFLASILASSFGRMFTESEHRDKQTKRDVFQVLGYLNRIEEQDGQHSWEDEIDLLECFVRLMKVHFGRDAVRLHCTVVKGDYPALPWGTLLFPLENCLKHALLSPDYPVDYQLELCSGKCTVVCTNYWSPKEHQAGGMGFKLMEARLRGSCYELIYNAVKTDDKYKLTLNLNWENDEKISLSGAPFG
jgi:cytochrome c oxidase subunit IV